ncbi:hypothetical protein CYMTET_24411 [Cymbomonas tetramitiformis]|uniref:Pseudouridine synthase RsuA/RluA-like domain-containing protein n=1 Tax=Cymbomonas tetramitiformis TaxID=36881 RepID=A0AAE0FQ49_9CHLO|nr:hypothetical protein CYMTET_27379 [Cymbomonas tetramitiformis]KAK3267010.1 hypothetical protein CYMTET_24411 [Cymbomonas tetramitiformis]
MCDSDAKEVPRLARADLKEAVADLVAKDAAPEQLLPYPTQAGVSALAAMLGVKEKLARKAVVDARSEGLLSEYPANQYIYVLFHKPINAVCARQEVNRFAGSRNTIYDVLPPGVPHVPHVGRLDMDTSGLLLLTDDGPLHDILLRKDAEPARGAPVDQSAAAVLPCKRARDVVGRQPGKSDAAECEVEGVSKVYHVEVEPGKGVQYMHGGAVDVEAAVASLEQPLAYGAEEAELRTAPAKVRFWDPAASSPRRPEEASMGPARSAPEGSSAGGDTAPTAITSGDTSRVAHFEITICEGKNRQVRKLCARAGLIVRALHRVKFGPLELGGLDVGEARNLTDDEVAACYLSGQAHLTEGGNVIASCRANSCTLQDLPRVLKIDSLP